MKPILLYLLQVIAASGLLYGYYHFALRNKKFHRYNRFYLLMTIAISSFIPFLNIPVYFSEQETESSVVLQTLQVISSSSGAEYATPDITAKIGSTTFFTTDNLLYIFYFTILLFLFFRVAISLGKIRSIIKRNTVEQIEKIKFVNTDEPGTPFSFFRWLFWNRNIEMNSEKGEQIFRHELFHIQQKHSWDIIFMELVSTILWINPFFHIIKKELKAIHEFLADEFAIHENKNWQYAELLLMQAFNTSNRLVNPFFHNQIKRRIAMITTSTKPSYRYLRKIMVLPIAAIIIFMFAFTYKNAVDANNLERSVNPITIVIDAGHGGPDAGVKSKDGKYSEAQLCLAISKKIQQLANEYNISVVMTREDDHLPGKAAEKNDGLRKRVAITNSADPFALISIHLSADRPGSSTGKSGIEGYVSNEQKGKSDIDLASAILEETSSVYPTDKTIKRRDNGVGVYIIDEPKCPTLLLECGYMTNEKDLAFITNDDNQEKLARAILAGLVKFANSNSQNPRASISGFIDKNENGIYSEIELTDTVPLKTKDLNNHLVVIDGIVQQRRGLKNIDSALVLNKLPVEIRIFKVEDAIKKYGDKGKDGVIEISTENHSAKIPKTIPDTLIWINDMPAPVKKSPTSAQLKTWEDPKMYGVWIDGKRIKNDQLSKYAPSDFSLYNSSKLAKNAINYGKHYYQINLYTEKYYTEKIDTKKNQGVMLKEITLDDAASRKEPLLVIDNKPRPNLSFKTSGKEVLPEEIERVVLLKDKQATDKYGVDAKNGVIEITTNKTGIKKPIEIREVELQPDNDNKVFERTEIEASFPGGVEGWRKFLTSSLNPIVPVDSGAKEGKYTVILQFIVNKNGSISNIKALTNHKFGMEEECIRVMKLSPNWNPAIQNGHIVTAYRKQPFTFVIADDDDETEPAKEVEVKGFKTPAKTNTQQGGSKPGEVEEVTVIGHKINNAKLVDQLAPIYPNPTTNSLTIPFDSKSGEEMRVRVYDLLSNLKMEKKVLPAKGKANIHVDVTSLISGTYMINVLDKSGNVLSVHKMIKK